MYQIGRCAQRTQKEVETPKNEYKLTTKQTFKNEKCSSLTRATLDEQF